MVVWIDVVGTNKFHSNRNNPVDDLSDTVSNLWNTLGPATDESFSIQYWEESLPVNPNTCAVPTRHVPV